MKGENTVQMLFRVSMQGGIFNWKGVKENKVRTFIVRLAKEDIISDSFRSFVIGPHMLL